MKLSKSILCALCINQFDASNWKKRKSEFHQLKELKELKDELNDTKFYFSQNCPHNKKFDRSLAKNNFSYNLMV